MFICVICSLQPGWLYLKHCVSSSRNKIVVSIRWRVPDIIMFVVYTNTTCISKSNRGDRVNMQFLIPTGENNWEQKCFQTSDMVDEWKGSVSVCKEKQINLSYKINSNDLKKKKKKQPICVYLAGYSYMFANVAWYILHTLPVACHHGNTARSTVWVHEQSLCDFFTSGNREYRVKSQSLGKEKPKKYQKRRYAWACSSFLSLFLSERKTAFSVS